MNRNLDLIQINQIGHAPQRPLLGRATGEMFGLLALVLCFLAVAGLFIERLCAPNCATNSGSRMALGATGLIDSAPRSGVTPARARSRTSLGHPQG